MDNVQRNDAIKALNAVAREMEHWAFREDMDRIRVESMRERVLFGVKMLYEDDNIIRALMGEYGDECDIDGSGGETNGQEAQGAAQ